MSTASLTSSGTDALLLRSAEQNTQVAATLLKKVNDADKNLVQTLLPSAPSTSGRLDIRA